MAADNNFKQVKSGPFRGLNLAETDNALGEGQEQFAKVMENMVLDQDTGELRLREGVSVLENVGPVSPILGITTYNNPDPVTGINRPQLIIIQKDKLIYFDYTEGSLIVNDLPTTPYTQFRFLNGLPGFYDAIAEEWEENSSQFAFLSIEASKPFLINNMSSALLRYILSGDIPETDLVEGARFDFKFLKLNQEKTYEALPDNVSVSFAEVGGYLYIQIDGKVLKKWDGRELKDAGFIPGAAIAENCSFSSISSEYDKRILNTTDNAFEYSSDGLNPINVTEYPTQYLSQIPTHSASGSSLPIPNRMGWYFKTPLTLMQAKQENDFVKLTSDFAVAHLERGRKGEEILGDASASLGHIFEYTAPFSVTTGNYKIKEERPTYNLSPRPVYIDDLGAPWRSERPTISQGTPVSNYFNEDKSVRNAKFIFNYPGANNFIQLTELFSPAFPGQLYMRKNSALDQVILQLPEESEWVVGIDVGDFVYFNCVLYVDYWRTDKFNVGNVRTYPYKIQVKAKVANGSGVLSSGQIILDDNMEYMFLPSLNAPYTGQWIKCTWYTMLNSKTRFALNSLVPQSSPNNTQNFQYGIALEASNPGTLTTSSFLKTYIQVNVEGTDEIVGQDISYPYTSLETLQLVSIDPFFSEQQKWEDPYYLIPPENMGPTTLIDNQQYLPDSARFIFDEWASKFGYDYNNLTRDLTVLQKAKYLSSYNNRLLQAGIQDAPNTVFTSDNVFGPDTPNLFGQTSFIVNPTEPGEFITGIRPFNASLAILCQNSVHLVQGDFASNTIRIDELASGGFGCLSNDSLKTFKNSLVWLSAEGPVILNPNELPAYLGATRTAKLSRVRSLVRNKSLNLSRAFGIIDTQAEMYRLQIPSTVSGGQPLILAYDFINDAWSTKTGFDFSKGAVEFFGDLFFVGVQKLSRFNRTGTLEDFIDKDKDEFGAVELRPIPYVYESLWNTFGDPSIQKKVRSFQLYQTNKYGVDNDPSIRVDILADYRDDLPPHSYGVLAVSYRRLIARLKLKPAKLFNIKYRLSGSEAYKSPAIQSFELEVVPIYKGQTKPWVRSGR